MLIPSLIVLAAALLAGMALGVRHILLDRPAGRLTWQGAAHGLAGTVGVCLLLYALAFPDAPPSAHAARMGAGGFGRVAGGLLTAALAGGFVMLAANLRRRPISGVLVAAHSMAALFGYLLLATYFTMLY